MIIYKCVFSDDEMFSDVFKFKEVENGILYEVEGKGITRTQGDLDDSLFGGNASAEEQQQECTDESSVSGVNIVLNHNLKETGYTKKEYLAHIKAYVKAIKARLQETNPERVEAFVNNSTLAVKKIMENFTNYQFFTGESMCTEGMVVLLDYREDGITPFMLFFKDGLVGEKC